MVAHPPDPEDGVRYASVYEHARAAGLPVIRARPSDPDFARFVANANADLLWITDYRYLVPDWVLEQFGGRAVNLHPSLLPAYRGRASLNWAILRGETELGLTAHFVGSGIDNGDIIAQHRFGLRADQDVGDALAMLMPIYETLTRDVLAMCRSGSVARMPQDETRATVFPRRRPADGLIDWTADNVAIRNLVRAVAAPYPGAFTTLGGEPLIVWRAELAEGERGLAPGTVHSADESPVVQCGRGALRLTKIELGAGRTRPLAGARLGAGTPASPQAMR